MIDRNHGTFGFAQSAVSVDVFGGVVDALAIIVKGVTGDTDADKETAAAALLDAIRVNGDIIKGDASTAFATGPLKAEDFRQIGNASKGYAKAQTGALIPTGRRYQGDRDGYSLRLDWSDFDSAVLPVNASVSAATVSVYRLTQPKQIPAGMLATYAARKVDAREVTPLVSNLVKTYFRGSNLTEIEVAIAGRDLQHSPDVAKLVSAMEYRHEDEEADPITVLYDGDLAASQTPPTIRVTADSGRLIQVGLIPA